MDIVKCWEDVGQLEAAYTASESVKWCIRPWKTVLQFFKMVSTVPIWLSNSTPQIHLLLLLLLLSRFSRVRLCDPIDGSPPGSPVPGALQARTLEWAAISFSNAWKWKAKVKSLSHVWPSATPWTAAFQAPLSMGFSRQEYWSGVPLPSPITILSVYISNSRAANT